MSAASKFIIFFNEANGAAIAMEKLAKNIKLA